MPRDVAGSEKGMVAAVEPMGDDCRELYYLIYIYIDMICVYVYIYIDR